MTISIISFISSFEVINIFSWIVASVSDSDAVNPIGIKTLLANGLSTFPIVLFYAIEFLIVVY